MNSFTRVYSIIALSVFSNTAETSMSPTKDTCSKRASYSKTAEYNENDGSDTDDPASLSIKKKVNNQQIGNSSNFTGKFNPGRFIYKSRCTLCHGNEGKGDGRMAMVVTNPPPFDLSNSVASKSDTILIIKKGGKSVGRSPQMPPWDDELNDKQIDSLVTYLFTFRK